MLHNSNDGRYRRNDPAARLPGPGIKPLTKAQRVVRNAMLKLPGCCGTVTDINKAMHGGKYVHAERDVLYRERDVLYRERDVLYRVLAAMVSINACTKHYDPVMQCSSYKLTFTQIKESSHEEQNSESDDIEEIRSLVELY